METKKKYLPPKVTVAVIGFKATILNGSLNDWAVEEIPGEEFEDED